MNKSKLKQIILYSLSMLILFSIPIYTITTNNNILKDGTEYLFKVTVFDPYDMFRGNYLNISFKENSIRGYSGDWKRNNNNKYYATIGKDSDGFAYFKNISPTKPKNTTDYFKTTAYYSVYSGTYNINTPTRYYMNEKRTLKAEQIYQKNNDNVYIKVRVKNGKMVIVGVYMNGILIDTIE